MTACNPTFRSSSAPAADIRQLATAYEAWRAEHCGHEAVLCPSLRRRPVGLAKPRFDVRMESVLRAAWGQS